MSPALSVVAARPDATPETLSARVKRLQAEARELARDHILALTVLMADVQAVALEIAEGGPAYPAGVRDLTRRLAGDCEARIATIENITARSTL